jgi:hypothetical protein
MSRLSEQNVARKGRSAPGGTQLNASAAFAGTDPKWPAGKRPEKFNYRLSLRTPEGRNIPTPGNLWARCHRVTPLRVDYRATLAQIGCLKPHMSASPPWAP